MFSSSKIALTASSWLDDYISWLDPIGDVPCCRKVDYILRNETIGNKTVERKWYPGKFIFCKSEEKDPNWHCSPCRNASESGSRPRKEEFRKYLSSYLTDNPNTICTKG